MQTSATSWPRARFESLTVALRALNGSVGEKNPHRGAQWDGQTVAPWQELVRRAPWMMEMITGTFEWQHLAT